MTQKTSDEKKIDKIRLLLDDPTHPSDHQDKYLSTLQERLQKTSHYRPRCLPDDSSDAADLRPRVMIHQKEESISYTKPQQIESSEKKPQEEIREALGDHELFEIEYPHTPEVPEFIEVKPRRKESSEEEIRKDEEILPEWSAIENNEDLDKKIEETLNEETKLKSSERCIEEETIEKPQSETNFEEIIEKKKKSTKPETSIWEPIERKQEKTLQTKPEKEPIEEMEFIIMDEDKPSESTIKHKNPITPLPQQKPPKEEPKKPIQQTPPVQKNNTYCTYRDYTLYKKEIKIGKDKEKTIHFFSKEPPEEGNAVSLPKGYQITINKKTGVPYIKEK